MINEINNSAIYEQYKAEAKKRWTVSVSNCPIQLIADWLCYVATGSSDISSHPCSKRPAAAADDEFDDDEIVSCVSRLCRSTSPAADAGNDDRIRRMTSEVEGHWPRRCQQLSSADRCSKHRPSCVDMTQRRRVADQPEVVVALPPCWSRAGQWTWRRQSGWTQGRSRSSSSSSRRSTLQYTTRLSRRWSPQGLCRRQLRLVSVSDVGCRTRRESLRGRVSVQWTAALSRRHLACADDGTSTRGPPSTWRRCSSSSSAADTGRAPTLWRDQWRRRPSPSPSRPRRRSATSPAEVAASACSWHSAAGPRSDRSSSARRRCRRSFPAPDRRPPAWSRV